MQQRGLVIATRPQMASVQIMQHSACASCGKCDLGHESRSLVVTAVNSVNALAGQQVILSMAKNNVLQAGFLAYTLPLLAMFLGAFLGQYWAGQRGSLLGGFGALLVSYLLMHFFVEPYLAKNAKFNIRITKIISEEADIYEQDCSLNYGQHV